VDESHVLPKFLTQFSWADAASMAVFFLVLVALQDWAHWEFWLALVTAIAAQFAVQVAALAIKDIWPRPVPPELAPGVAKLEREGGFRLKRLHPWLCTEKDPHCHVIAPGGATVTVTLKKT
jgi:hypothetical protein